MMRNTMQIHSVFVSYDQNFNRNMGNPFPRSSRGGVLLGQSPAQDNYRRGTARQQLESYLAAVSQFSPKATPERFSSRNDELAYWMYGYNAYVIRSVLDHWPLDSHKPATTKSSFVSTTGA